jgi:hypothetical protein
MRRFRQTNPRVDEEFNDVDRRLTELRGGLLPVGTMVLWSGALAPSGWLLCDGSSYAVQTYPDLATTIEARGGTPSPDNENTFKVPTLNETSGESTVFNYIIKAVP